jgi:hypothetical protein
MLGWCIAGLKASAWSRLFMARTRCGVRRRPRSIDFEQIQRGLECIEDEWIYMNRGLGIPDRFETLPDGTIKGPSTDELFMREYIREWKRLMADTPNNSIRREV